MKVYFVRHGESMDAQVGLHQRFDSQLSGVGKEQAMQLSRRLEDVDMGKIMSSTLARASQTAEVIAENKKMEVQYSDLLVELRKPSVLVGTKRNSVETDGIKNFIKENFGKNVRHSDEENFDDFKERLLKFIELLNKEECESVLVVTHGYVIKFLFGLFVFGDEFNWELASKLFGALKMKTTGLTLFERNGNDWKLVTWNDIAHLAE